MEKTQPRITTENEMRQRIETLEKRSLRQLFGLDWLVALGDFQRHSDLESNRQSILDMALQQLNRLMKFHVTAFYILEKDSFDLKLNGSEPQNGSERIEREFNFHLEQGTIAWVLNQNRPVIVKSGELEQKTIFHTLATTTSVRGLFIGVIANANTKEYESIQYLLSIFFQHTANTLESTLLYKKISRQNSNLEKTVQNRTRELQEQTVHLKKEIAERQRVLQAWETSETKMKTIVKNVAAGIITLDDKGRVKSFNPMSEKIFGYLEAEVLGQPVKMLIPLMGRKIEKFSPEKNISSSRLPYTVSNSEVEGVRRDGSNLPLELAFSAMMVDKKLIFTGIFHDITKQKKARTQQDLQYALTRLFADSSSLQEAIPNILKVIGEFLQWDLSFYWNVNTEETGLQCQYGWHSEAIDKESFEKFEKQSLSTLFREGVGLPGRIWRTHLPAWISDVTQDANFPRAPQAEEMDLHSGFGFPVMVSQKVVGVIEVFTRNICEPEEDHVKLLASLGSQIGQFIDKKNVQSQIVKAKEEADRANRAKSEFLANMSHEIRTPMNSIMGMADLLSESSLSSEQKQYVQLFRSAGESLLILINDILDHSKIESGSFELESIPFFIRDLIQSTVQIMDVRAHEKSVSLIWHMEPDVPSCLMGDPYRLRQILTNLMGNAIKFTEQGSVYVHIEVNQENKKSAFLKFSVTDTGIGILSDKMVSIFSSFSQAESDTTRKFGGTGLGLAISQKLSEKMGGDIGVESKEGEGSTFFFNIPFAIANASEKARALENSPNLFGNERPARPSEINSAAATKDADKKPLKILLVDDSADNRLLIQLYMKKTNHEMDMAENGEIAVQKAFAEKYDLIFMDIQMPVMDGYTATRKIREFEKEKNIKNIPVLALTAHALKGEKERCLQAGCSGYITKPVKKEKFLKIIDDFAEHKNEEKIFEVGI